MQACRGVAGRRAATSAFLRPFSPPLARHISTCPVLQSRAKRPLSLRKKDAVDASAPRSPEQRAQRLQQEQHALQQQQQQQSAQPPTVGAGGGMFGGGGLGGAIAEGFSFGIGSAIARRMVDSMWPGGGGDASGGGGGIAGGGGGGSGGGGGGPPPSSPQQPAAPSVDEDGYANDPYDNGGDDGDDEF